MTLAQARRRSSTVGWLRVVFVACAAISAGVIIGPIAATALSSNGQKIDQVAGDEVITMVNARFTGRNIAGEAYIITAAEARRRRADSSIVDLVNPRLVDDKGTEVGAPIGVFTRMRNISTCSRRCRCAILMAMSSPPPRRACSCRKGGCKVWNR